jgi:hypothetical protein
MAAIAASQVTVLKEEGDAERAVLYRVRNVDTADTWDCSVKFNEVKAATFIAAGVLSTVGTVTIAGTVLTLTLATMADDAIYLLVVGSAAV